MRIYAHGYIYWNKYDINKYERHIQYYIYRNMYEYIMYVFTCLQRFNLGLINRITRGKFESTTKRRKYYITHIHFAWVQWHCESENA